MEDDHSKTYEIISLVYFFIGAVCGLLGRYTEFEILDIIAEKIGIFYLLTYAWSTIVYLIEGCLLYKHRYFLMSLVDGILCFCLAVFYPYPVLIYIYDFNKYIYYLLGLCFSLLPLFYCKIDKIKIGLFHILKSITRFFMILFVIVIILIMKSCESSILG